MFDRLLETLATHPRWVVLTGAGISAASGIPTYRNDRGEWQRSDPIQHQDFVARPEKRRRYWARSMIGWPHVRAARPNAAHLALADLERLGHVRTVVTQNVDRLHQAAGSRRVVDLHGRLDRVRCLGCASLVDRERYQRELAAANPDAGPDRAEVRPDGDAEIDERRMADFQVPPCRACGGVLMPDVVFFGGSVPRDRVDAVRAAIDAADALLVVGSSLMVYSGFRFCRQAVEAGKPLCIVNRGRTRADDMASRKFEADGAETLCRLREALRRPGAGSLATAGPTALASP